MRRPESSDGFLVCFLLNMLWEAGWGIATAILLILHFNAGLPGAWWRWTAAVWLLVAFVKTALIEWVGNVSTRRDPEKPNKNPYSVKSQKPVAEAEAQQAAAAPEAEAQQAAAAREGARTPETQRDEIQLQLQPAPAEVDLEKLNAALDGLKNQTGELTLESARGQTM